MIILLSVTFILFILVHQFWWRRQGYPNGPLPLPIVGNIHQFAFHKRWEDKLVEFKEQYGSVYTLFLGPIPVITINDYDTCVQLFAKEGDIYSNRPTLQHFNQITRNGTYGLGQTNGQQWLEQRRAVLRILKDFGLGKNQMQERILDEIHTICDNLNNELKKGVVEHNINQYTDIAIGSVINSLICGYRFTTNNKASEFEHLKHWSDRFTHLITDPITSMGIYSERLSRWPLIRNKITDLREVFDELFSFVDRAIEEHKAHNDYEHTEDKQAKIHDELNRVIGSDRTISMSDRFNLPYLNAAINEAQRCSALPVFNVPHALAKDANLNGYNLKKETIIFPQISTIMKDPANFPSPNNFYPERFIDSNGQLFNTEKVVSFSIGKRSCPGEGLARMELFLLTANLLNQYKVSFNQRKF
ncbi:(pine wood nematode) hypothetical protein [Aphelenchoides bicaudatus]|nr:(pine wood nematode) hypothetical protein [Aphelenchoides bicaudatus]